MPLADGDPAPQGDVWYRILTSDKYINRGGVQHAAFQGKAIKPPPQNKNRPWQAELSGRLLSLAGTHEEVQDHCTAYCKAQNRTFYGVMYPKEREQPLHGSVVTGITLGIYYTPLDDGDEAHSDLTFSGSVPFAERSEEHDRFVMALSKKFHGAHPRQLDMLTEKISGAVVQAPAIVMTAVQVSATAPETLGILDAFMQLMRAIFGKK